MKLTDAQQFLKDLGFPEKQRNKRAAETLLALGELDFSTPADNATRKMHGVRPIMDWFRNKLNDDIAENSRETIRREVLKYFVEAGLCHHNEDCPDRPTNSSKNNYSLTPNAHELLKSYGTATYPQELETYLEHRPGLIRRYQRSRELTKIPVILPDGVSVALSAGGQNPLIAAMIREFCSRFISEPNILYIGDTAQKYVLFEKKALESLGITIDSHGKMPDLIVYSQDKNWLFLMEAASTHGPVDNIRYGELTDLFGSSTAGLVYVSCFNDKANMRQYAADLAWETEVWIATDPDHMMHLNGSRFLGPYSK